MIVCMQGMTAMYVSMYCLRFWRMLRKNSLSDLWRVVTAFTTNVCVDRSAKRWSATSGELSWTSSLAIQLHAFVTAIEAARPGCSPQHCWASNFSRAQHVRDFHNSVREVKCRVSERRSMVGLLLFPRAAVWLEGEIIPAIGK